MSRTILIVDDSNAERVVLKGYLKADYNVLAAASGEEAIEVLHKHFKSISAIVMDVVMPGMGGFETLREIKSHAVWLNIPVVITTGLDDEESREKAVAYGADNFITKPFNRMLLLHTVRNAIRLKETAALVNTRLRDNLTGLLNREAFFSEAERMIRQSEPGSYALSCFDVENFKIVNDQYGTDVGDEVLRHIANCLHTLAADHSGLACRYTADKFAALLPEMGIGAAAVDECVDRLVRPPCLPRDIRVRIGRYLINDLTLSIGSMYDRASMAESSVKGRFDAFRAEYTETMRDDILREQQIVNDMVNALAAGEFEPWLQPQFNHATGALIGAEALVRWRRDGRIVPPDDFIPVFERNGFIYEVDQYIWRQVCALLRRWLDEGKNPLPISVNISRYDLHQANFIDVLNGLLAEYKLPFDLLRLEITESALSESANVVTDAVGRLIATGFTVEIDDFGSGYSSLNTLKDVPASILKLDMRFFETTENAERSGNIVESIVRMAKWLGMAIIAEGVETQAQADYLKSIGCYYIQGYYYAKPMPVADYEQQMAACVAEPKLSRLVTLKNMDNNEFWNPKSMETLIFNSYVGGACIFEYKDGKTELLRINDRYIDELHGLLPADAELKDCSLFRFFDGESQAALLRMLQTAAEQQREAACELRLVNGAQTEYVRLTARVIAHAGERLLYYGVIVNMTEQRMAEHRAIVASEQNAAILDNSQCGITAVILHKKGKMESLFANNRFYEILGYTKEQFRREVGDAFQCIVPEDRERVFRSVIELDQIGQTISHTLRVTRRDGRIAWIRKDTAIVKFEGIHHPIQLSNYIDITEQMEMERKRMESAEQLRIIMSNINGSVSAFLLDDAGNTQLIFGNAKYYEIFGYSKEQAAEIQLDVMSCIVPEDFGMVVETLGRLKRDGVPVTVDYRAQKQDGSLVYIRCIASRMSMEGYGDEVIVSVETDITHQRTLEDQLRAVMDNINGGVSATFLKEGVPEFLIVNDKYYDLIGYTKEQFESEVTNVFDLIHPEDRERVEKLVHAAAQDLKPYTMEYRLLRRNGAVRYILCNINVMHLFGVDVPVQLAVSNDVTVLREAQQKERSLSTQMHTIMEHIHGGITATVFHSKDDVELIFCNDGFYALYGYTKEQLEKELPNMLDLILPEDREKTMNTVARIVAERSCATYEYRCRKRDGSVMWTQVTNAVISLAGVGDTVLLAIVTDITALRLAERQNRETMDRLSAVMNAMQNGVTAVAFHGDHTEFLFANERYYRMHGITREEYEQTELGASLALVHPEDRAGLREQIMQTTAIGQTGVAEYRMLRPDGSVRWAKAVIHVTSLSGVSVPVQVTIFTDIDAEKKAERQLQFLNETAHSILAQPQIETAINDTLMRINGYFHGDRTYVVELDEEKQITRNTYEFCAQGVCSQIDQLQEVAFSPADAWFRALLERDFLVVENVDALDGEQAQLRELLLRQGIHSIILAALRRDGKLIGFAGTDNPDSATEQVSQLTALSVYIAVLLTRRDLKRSYERERENTQLLMDDTPGGFCRLRILPGKMPKLSNVNGGFCRMLGMTEAEIFAAYGEDIHACLNAEDFAALPADIADAAKNGGQFSTKCRLRKKDGADLWTMVFGRFVKDGNGDLFLNAYFTDITAQKDAEQNQIELLDNLPAGAALYEYDGRDLKAVHINRRYWKLVGRKPPKDGKLSVFDAVHPDDRALIRQELESAIRQHRNAEADCRVRCGENGYRPFHIAANILQKEGGVYTLCASYTPISEEAMSIQEMLPIALSTMVASTDDMSYVKDRELRYVCVSRSVADMAGVLDPRDCVGKSAAELFDAAFAEQFNADDRRVLKTGKPVKHVLEHIPMADGSVCLARTSKFPILDSHGNAVGVYCVSRDVTAQKEKESQLELLTASIPGGLAAYSLSKDGFTTLYFNDGYFAYSGYTREEYMAMTEKDPLALMYEEDKPKILELVHGFAARKADGMTGGCVYRCRTKTGGMRWMSMKAVLSQVGEDAYVLNAVQLDVTDRMELESKRTQLLDNLPFGAALFNFDGSRITAVHINAQYLRMVNRTIDGPLENFHPLDFIHPDDRQAVLDEVKKAIAEGRNATGELRLLYGGDEYRTFRVDANITQNGDGTYMLFAAYTRVTDQEKEERERRRLAEEEYRLAAAHANRTICRYNIEKRTLTVAADVAERLSLPEVITDVPYGRVRLNKVSPETADAYIAFFESIMRGKKECAATFRKLLNGDWRWIDARATTIFGDGGKPVSAIISYMDVTEQREKEAVYSRWQNSLADRPESSYTLFRCNLSKSMSFDSRSGSLLLVSFADENRSFDELTGEYVMQHVYADDRERYRAFLRADTMLAEYYRGHRTDAIEYREQNPDGSVRWLRLSVDLVEYPDSNDVEAYLMYENIDEEKRRQLRTIERAETDPLTGVLNRATFAVRVNQAVSRSRPGTRHALLMLDVDCFKQVNDIFGHGAGDQALIDIADLLTRSSRKGDLVGRLGGDEFLLFMADIPNESAAAARARQICELVRKTYSVDVQISASIGVALYPQDGEGFESLYKVADETLYRVKDTGKNGFAFSHDEPVSDASARREPETQAAPVLRDRRVRRMLIADDSEQEQALLGGLFADRFRIEKATNGATTLMKLRHYGSAISVVLLNWTLPDMDGFELLTRLQENESTRGIPVIVVSADESRETTLAVIRAGASDLVPKPVDADILRLRVESAVSRAENERLRAQNSYLSMRNTEVSSYKSALERSGIMVVSLNWGTNEFSYSPSVSSRLIGQYDGRNFWRALLSDLVTDSQTVQKMQRLVHDIAEDRERTEGGMTVRLKTVTGLSRQFEMNVFKEIGDNGLADKMIMTLREMTPAKAEN